MSTNVTAAKSGIFRIGGETEVNRLGFGSMRLTGPGIWGPPPDRKEAIRTLERLPSLGVNFIDTADSYGPNVAEELLREVLHPYTGMVIATKAGLARTGPDGWTPLGRPEYLIQQAYTSCQRLGVEQIPLWQLHRIDPKVPRDEQFDAVKWLLDKGVIRHAGLSEVSVAEIEAASRHFEVATVQNRYNLVDRSSEEVVDHCTRHRIGFIPWFPLAAGNLAAPGIANLRPRLASTSMPFDVGSPGGSVLDTLARRHEVAPSQIALAWTLRRSPVMLPIPGTSKASHLEENVAAAGVTLSDEDFAALDKAGHAQ